MAIRSAETYLGDSVYASFDGYTLWLRNGGNHLVGLEPDVLKALVNYVGGIAEVVETLKAALAATVPPIEGGE